MPYFQIQTNVDEWPFDFSGVFPSSDSIASTVVLCDPTGLTELTAKSSTSGLQRKLVIDAASATKDTDYVLGCQCTSAAGLRHTIYKTIRVIEDETGAAAIATSAGANAIYIALLSQTGTSAPTATVLKSDLTGTPVWTRQSTGLFLCTLASAFPLNKTTVSPHIIPLLVGNESKVSGKRISDNVAQIQVRDFADNLVDGFDMLTVSIQTYL